MTLTSNNTVVRSVESDVSIFGLPTKRRYFVVKTASHDAVLCTRMRGSVAIVVCQPEGCVASMSDNTAVRSLLNNVSIFGIRAKWDETMLK